MIVIVLFPLIYQKTSQPLTPPSFRKDHFLVNTSGSGGASSGSGGLFKSASAISVGRDFSGSVTPIQHQRKISYQNSHLFRSSGSSGSSSRTEISNLIRVRNSQLGKSAPSLSPSSVSSPIALHTIRNKFIQSQIINSKQTNTIQLDVCLFIAFYH